MCDGEVDYARSKLAIGSYTALVDHILRPSLLHLVTVEFSSVEEARAFHPLGWFGPEVTGQARFTNQGLVLNEGGGMSDVPLSDGALNSLIDALDNRFPAQARIPINRPQVQQLQGAIVLKATASEVAYANEVSLKDVEAAMMREMELTIRNRPVS